MVEYQNISKDELQTIVKKSRIAFHDWKYDSMEFSLLASAQVCSSLSYVGKYRGAQACKCNYAVWNRDRKYLEGSWIAGGCISDNSRRFKYSRTTYRL